MLKLLQKKTLTIFLLLLISFFLRLYFFLRLRSEFSTSNGTEILWGFLHGIRFDLSALFYVNVIFLIALSFKVVRKSFITGIAFSVFNSVYITLCLSDIDHYLAYGKKIGPSFLTVLEGMNLELLSSMAFFYSHLIVIFFISIFTLYFLYKKIWLNAKIYFYSKKLIGLEIFLVLIVCLISIRGGFQKRVLGKQHTMLFTKGNHHLGHLTSNTVHNLIRSKYKYIFPEPYNKNLKIKNWVENYQSVVKQKLNKVPKNVMIIFVEGISSFAVEKFDLFKFDFMNKKSAAQKDFIFVKNMYANGRISMDAFASVFFGMPSLFETHLFGTKYAQNEWVGLPSVFESNGITSSIYIDSATKGSQFFDIAAGAAGFKFYRSIEDEFDVDSELKGLWGPHDEVLYEKTLQILENLKDPFFISIFTVSSHIPFFGTPNNKKSKGNLELDYFESVKYASQALGDFFNKVKDNSYFEDTLFLVFGDHSPPILTSWNQDPLHDSRMPFLMYYPGSNIGDIEHRKFIQHIDIPNTLFDVFNINPEKWAPYGQSIFKTDNLSPLFYTGSENREITLITESGEILSRESINNKKNPEFEYVDSFISDYIYRLENNKVYEKTSAD